MEPLTEKYRPRCLTEMLGQEQAVRQVRAVLKRGWGGRAWWISGKSGTGKSSLAWIIARQRADDWFVEEYDSGDGFGVEELDHVSTVMYYTAAGKGGRAFVINEAHGLRANVIRGLLGVLERIPRHVVFIFTTTFEGQKGLFDNKVDASPLLSRCVPVELTTEGLAEVFAAHCKQVARFENLDGKPIESYIELAQKCKLNCRAMLQAIESGAML